MALQFNVATLLKEEVGSTRAYEIGGRVIVDDELQHRDVTGDATFLRTKDGILVTAEVHGEERATCSRCLAEVVMPVAVSFEEEFFASTEDQAAADASQPSVGEAFLIDAKHVLDLEEAIRQSWSVALPMQPLCRSECRGICPRCGQDLNESECSCQPGDDPRWSALRQMAGKMEGT